MLREPSKSIIAKDKRLGLPVVNPTWFTRTRTNSSVTVLTSNPVNTKALDDLRVIFNKRIKPIVSTSQRIQDAINRVYEKSTAALSGLDEIDEDVMDLEEVTVTTYMSSGINYNRLNH